MQIKWYLAASPATSCSQDERVQRDQLDGLVSGGMLCQRLSPSMRATGMAAEFRDRDEANYVLGRLKPTLDAEFAKAGYAVVGTAGIGFSVFFSRTPIRTMADLKRLQSVAVEPRRGAAHAARRHGPHIVPLPVEAAARAYDDGKVDGFIGLPSAALAFQWSSQARYAMDLRVGYLTGCILVSRRAWDSIGARGPAGDRERARPSCRCASKRRRGRWTTRSVGAVRAAGAEGAAGAAGAAGGVRGGGARDAAGRRRS